MEGNPALNRVRWAHSGREIAVGDSDGQVRVYEVGEVSEHNSLLDHSLFTMVVFISLSLMLSFEPSLNFQI